MTLPESTHPATSTEGHLVISDELRDRLRERLLGMLDVAQRRLDRADLDPALLAERQGATEAIEAIRAALVKLDAGYFGVCESCEGPIPFERLDAIPTVRTCVACQIRPQPLIR